MLLGRNFLAVPSTLIGLISGSIPYPQCTFSPTPTTLLPTIISPIPRSFPRSPFCYFPWVLRLSCHLFSVVLCLSLSPTPTSPISLQFLSYPRCRTSTSYSTFVLLLVSFVVCLVFSCSPPSFLRRQLFLYFANLVLGAYVMSDFDPDPYIEQRLHSSVTWEMYPVPHGYPTGLCPLISIRTLLFHSPSYPLPHHACNSIYQSSKVKDIQFSKHTSACWCWRGVGRE